MRLSNKEKQCLISMLYEIEQTNDTDWLSGCDHVLINYRGLNLGQVSVVINLQQATVLFRAIFVGP